MSAATLTRRPRERHTQAERDMHRLLVDARDYLNYAKNVTAHKYVRDAWRQRGIDPSHEYLRVIDRAIELAIRARKLGLRDGFDAAEIK